MGVGEDIIALIYTYKSDTSENNHPPIWFNLTIVIQPSETIRQSHLTPKNLKLFDNLIWHQKIWNHLIIITNTIWNHPIIIINTIWTHLIISGVWWFSLSQQYISHPTTLEQGNFDRFQIGWWLRRYFRWPSRPSSSGHFQKQRASTNRTFLPGLEIVINFEKYLMILYSLSRILPEIVRQKRGYGADKRGEKISFRFYLLFRSGGT